MKKEYLHTGLIALAAFVIVAFIQKEMAIPVIGKYLPKASA